MNQPLSKAMKDLLRWLVENFPDGSLEILWIGVGEPLIENYEGATPHIFTRARISQLVVLEFLSIYSSDGRSGNILLTTFIGASRKLEIDILPKTFELVASDFKAMTVSERSRPSDFSKTEWELARHLVDTARRLNPGDPRTERFLALDVSAKNSKDEVSIIFKAPGEHPSYWPTASLNSLKRRGLIVQEGKTVYCLVPSIFHLVDGEIPDGSITAQTNQDLPAALLKELLEKMDETFDEEGLRDLCFPILDHENIPGTIKRAKIRGLINHFRQHGHMDELISLLKRHRPTADWSQF